MPKSIWETLKQFGRGGPPPTPAEMISRVYGTGPRGGLNTRTAAADLGVSPAQCPAGSRRHPRLRRRHELQRSYRDWEDTTPAGRAVALQAVEAAKRGQPMAVAF